jgi:hypothetical protein
MPQAATSLGSAVKSCDDARTHCFVAAIMIDDKNKRIDAALKCLSDHADCISKAIKDNDTARTAGLIETLKKQRRHG